MRIVLINWPKLWDGASSGGGVNGYCQGLALELTRRGHDVISLCGGTDHAPLDASSTDPARWPCTVRRHPDWRGIRIFEVLNSPVLAPSMAQFADPLGEISSPALEREVHALLSSLAPDIVHFHNLEGFTAGCIDAARAARTPAPRILVSLHNYHPICPQVYLLQNHRRACLDYDNGHNCARCVDVPPPSETRRKRASAEMKRLEAAQPPPPPPPAPLRPLLHQLTRELRSLFAGPPPTAPPPAPSPFTPNLPGAAATDPSAPLHPPTPDPRGTTRPPDLADHTPVTNAILAEPPSDKPPNDYAARRAAMVSALSRCDAVLAVSNFVREKYASMGVNPAVLRTLHIGTRTHELIAAQPAALFKPAPFDPDPARARPVRAVFLGYNNLAKGLPMLADALELVPPRALARFHLAVHALNSRPLWPRFRRLENRLAQLTFREGYDHDDLPWLLAGADLGIVPSIWWDNAPQTVFEFHACRVPVLGAAVGGIPDFITDGHDGLLFRSNDRPDLARRLTEIAENPGGLAALRANIRPPKAMSDHAAELEQIYTDRLS